MIEDRNILQAIEPAKMYFLEVGEYPPIWSLKAVHNLTSTQARLVLKLAKDGKQGSTGWLINK